MESLSEICTKNTVGLFPDKQTEHTYVEVYQEKLAPYRETAKNILEIGILGGQSLLMWEQYFKGKCYGVDCDIAPIGGAYDLSPMIAEGTHNIIIMDGTSQTDIEKNFKDVMFDVIIDDGSHQLVHQLESYKHFKSHLNKGGIYIIEDIQNLDEDRAAFENIDGDKKVTILDRRSIKNRYDDVLIIIEDK
jgi:hypothetical protein